jgi:uncharacterized membrane protein YccF (DUF307 family)
MASTVVVKQGSGQHNLLLRFIWFVCVGWWLTGLLSIVAWACVVSVIGLPLGAFLLNRIPAAITLRQRSKTWEVTSEGGVTFLRQVNVQQRPIWVRAIWLVLIGWWSLAIWLFVAWLACVLVLSLPIGLWMYNRAPAVATLMRY